MCCLTAAGLWGSNCFSGFVRKSEYDSFGPDITAHPRVRRALGSKTVILILFGLFKVFEVKGRYKNCSADIILYDLAANESQ